MIRSFLALALAAQATVSHPEQSGHVVDPAGTRLAAVRVQSLPFEDGRTDASGTFRLTRARDLVRFSKPGFRPRTMTLTAASGQIVLVPAGQPPWTPPACTPTAGTRFGGIMQFTTPSGGRLRNSSDVDYQTTSLPHGRSWLEFGTGPHWTNGLPVASVFNAMTQVVERDVITPWGTEGAEYRVTRPDGTHWRTIRFFLESIQYDEARSADAAYFDRIMDSLCFARP